MRARGLHRISASFTGDGGHSSHQDERAGLFHRTLPDGTAVTSYKELYANKIKEQEAASKELRERQKHIKENHAPNAAQVKLFKDLHKLLRCKLDMQGRARAENAALEHENAQDTNVFTMPEDDGPPAY